LDETDGEDLEERLSDLESKLEDVEFNLEELEELDSKHEELSEKVEDAEGELADAESRIDDLESEDPGSLNHRRTTRESRENLVSALWPEYLSDEQRCPSIVGHPDGCNAGRAVRFHPEDGVAPGKRLP
jgi:chromosome segregation ATPase